MLFVLNYLMAKTILKTEQVTIRRSPKYLQFLLTGGAIGIIVAFILNASIAAGDRTAAPILGYLVLMLAALGVALGISAAVIIDRITATRAKTLEATKLEG